ncbi:hypothetical protein [Sphaerisporangium aureirubrum]|uniref:Lipoprotein n=1 Tax=Sphaerisporangium aureirubrum TaxID=1544736 RepID=A0ABW1NC56_9ACTN
MKKSLIAVCLVPLLLGTAAACSKPDDGRGVASVDEPAAPGASPSPGRMEQLLRYARCVREHGVPMQDPRADGDGVREGQIEEGFDKDKADTAQEACKQFRPPQESGSDVTLKQELSRQLARCMRERGVEQYPDPDPDGRTRVDSSVGEDPQFGEAKRFCEARADSSFASRRPTP